MTRTGRPLRGLAGQCAVEVAVVIVRCTARLRKFLAPVKLVEADPSQDDWYANLIWIDRRKCILLVHAGSPYPIFVPDVRKAELAHPGRFFAGTAVDALVHDGMAADALGTLDPTQAALARTTDRSVLGVMTDMAFLTEHLTRDSGGLAHLDIEAHNMFLRRTPYGRARDMSRPIDRARA